MSGIQTENSNQKVEVKEALKEASAPLPQRTA